MQCESNKVTVVSASLTYKMKLLIKKVINSKLTMNEKMNFPTVTSNYKYTLGLPGDSGNPMWLL